MIQAKALTKLYGSRKAISDVSFTINKGEIVGFLGPNGAGKTTTMKILTGYMPPNKGEVYLDGLDISKEPFLAKKKLGYLPEAPPVYTDMIVEDYLRYTAKLKLCPKPDISESVETAIERVGLQSVKKRLIQNLSKGFKQRLGLAQALVNNPDILILDEPTVGLDPKQVIEMRGILKKLKGDHTIILSTHILSEAQVTCDRVIIINEGNIIAEESLSSLSEKMQAKRRILLRVKKPSSRLLSDLKKIEGVLSVSENNKETFILDVGRGDQINESAAQAVISNSCGLIELKEEGFNLEELFIRLTEGKE